MRMLWAIATLTFVWSLCSPLGAQQKDAAAPMPHWRKPIVGNGATEDAAKDDAIKKAKEMVDGLRASMNPLVKSSDIADDEIKKRFLVDAGAAVDDFEIAENVFRKQWAVNLKSETERLLRADERETISYLVMIGLSIVLLAGFGYIRLDEYTQRKYTTWLRVASIGAVTSALVGWYAWFGVRG